MSEVQGKQIRDLTGTQFHGPLLWVPTTVAGATHSIGPDDIILLVTRTASGACTITWGTWATTSGRHLYIVDAGMNASVNNITITCESTTMKINGSTNDYVVSGDGNCLHLFCDGTDLFIL